LGRFPQRDPRIGVSERKNEGRYENEKAKPFAMIRSAETGKKRRPL
jgi:hypothetical protein